MLTEFEQAVLERLELIEARIAEVCRAVRKTPEPSSRREVLERLLPAIAGRWGSSSFQTKELLRDETIAPLLERLTSNQVGCLLREHASVPVGGYVVDRVTAEHGAALWVVSRILPDILPDPLP